MCKNDLYIFGLAFSLLIGQACTDTPNDASNLAEEGTSTVTDKSVGQVGVPVKDIEGNSYPTVTIGEQSWMAADLNTSTAKCAEGIEMRFTNGLERGPGVAFYDGKARYAMYNNQRDENFGKLYNYSAISQCDLCPSGYRIPTKNDWEKLIQHLGGETAAGAQLLKGGSSGFEGEMGGRIDDYGSVLKGSIGFWWSSDLDSSGKRVYTFEIINNGTIKLKPQDYRVGNAVRCIKE